MPTTIITDNLILEDSHVLLRALQPKDWENLLPFAMQEPDLWRYSLLSGAGEEGIRTYIQSAIGAKHKGDSFPFIVFDKITNTYAGSTRFYDIQPDYQTLQLGYTWYGKAFQGTGLNKHCKFLLLQYAFESLHMERVEFRADNDNKRSIAAMQSIGCKIEGVLRSNMPRPENLPGRRDSIVLSILKNEWENEIKEKLKKKIYTSYL